MKTKGGLPAGTGGDGGEGFTLGAAFFAYKTKNEIVLTRVPVVFERLLTLVSSCSGAKMLEQNPRRGNLTGFFIRDGF